MFTGIVEETGVIRAITPSAASIRLSLTARLAALDVKRGDSIAINGCCLTVVGIGRGRGVRQLDFDLLRETWDRTNLSDVQSGSAVNLERSLAVGARLGGHFVTGHIDGTGLIARWEQRGADHLLEIRAPAAVMRYVVFKGSIAVDGISLTVAGVNQRGFQVWIIPHTQQVTALRERRAGDRVNLEADLLGKYVEQFLASREDSRRPRRG